MQQLGRVRGEQHLVRGDDGGALLEARRTQAPAGSIPPTTSTTASVRPGSSSSMFSVHTTRRDPIDALPLDTSVEDVRELKTIGQLGSLDQEFWPPIRRPCRSRAARREVVLFSSVCEQG